MIKKELFGTLDGKDVYLFTLENKNGLTAEVITLGGIIKSLVFRGVDVVLGRDTLSEYTNNEGYYGALIGRNSNRIEDGKFTLNDTEYILAKNDEDINNLHGGNVGFDKKVWDAQATDSDEPKLMLTLTSPDGDEGFPGNIDVKVTYTLTAENSIKIDYEAKSDKDTPANFTNHSYFNLNGHSSGSVDGHTIMLNSQYYTPNKETCVPTGEILASKGSIFDLTSPRKMSEVFNSDHEQIKLFDGFDHNFCIDGSGFRKAAEFIGDKTGIVMETYTDLPGIQIYSGNAIEPDRVCKDGAVYDIHHAVCFETQLFPNSLNYSHFPCSVLKAGDTLKTTTEYKFK